MRRTNDVKAVRLRGHKTISSTHLHGAVLGGAEQAPVLVHPHRQYGATVPGQAVLLRMNCPQSLSTSHAHNELVTIAEHRQ